MCMQPLSVTENASFVVDVDVNFNDLKADNLGVWSTTGTKKSFFRFIPSGTLRVSNDPLLQLSPTTTHWCDITVHTAYERFHHQIVDIKGSMILECFCMWVYG